MTTDTLELEPIATARTEVATAASTALDLEKLNLTDLALAKFGDWRGAVAAATANLNTLALDLSTQARVNDAKSLRERLINVPRAEARKVSKALKSRLAATSKDIGAAEDQIVGAWDKAEQLITPKIEAAQQTLDAEKAEKARIEAARVQAHKDRMATIGAYLTACQAPGMTSERIARGIAMLAAATFDATWEEFQVPAADTQCQTLEAMRVLHAQVLGRELEAARQEQIRLENERQAEANRIEAKRIADETAKIRQEAAALEVEQAALRREQSIKDRIVAECAKAAAPGFKRFKPLPEGAVPGAAVNTTGQWYSASGRFMNEDGTRSIFCDVDESGEVEAPASAPVTAERWTDEDPDAATKLPTTEAVERTDPQEADVLAAAIAPEIEPHEFSLGDLSAWLGLAVNLVFVERMGIKPHAVPGNAARRLTKTQRREFRAALLRHVEGLHV